MPLIKNAKDLLLTFTQNQEVIRELLSYTENAFDHSQLNYQNLVSLPDEVQISTWEKYLELSQKIGVFQTLKKYLTAFQFPIKEGISQSKAYRSATLRGTNTSQLEEASGLELRDPDSLELEIYHSVAGKIPVLWVSEPKDFKSIIQALAYKNEPRHLPDSMGASIINGMNNWNRINQLRHSWESQNSMLNWGTYFKEQVLPNKSLYQDRLIVLSKKPYSGIPASELGLTQDDWIEKSSLLRLEHECAHYFTLRYLGGMYIHMHDELIADYMGIIKVLGHFNPDWFLSFMGLKGKTYKKGARLENYLGPKGLTPHAFAILQDIMRAACVQLHAFHREIGKDNSLQNRTFQLLSLASLSLVEIAAKHGQESLLEVYYALSKDL